MVNKPGWWPGLSVNGVYFFLRYGARRLTRFLRALSATVFSSPNSALARALLRRRKWLLPRRVRRSWPLPLRRNRLLVALCVLILGTLLFLLSRRLLGLAGGR